MKSINLLLLVSAAVFVGFSPSTSMGKDAVIFNTAPRTDQDGNIIDAHDGCLEYFEGEFYLYGTRYKDTDGFSSANRYVCYSSPDLVHWRFRGELLKSPPVGVYYRPYVKYNPKTKKYVLWYNWYAVLWEGQYGTAVADHPAGPFIIQNPNVKVKHALPGDHGLLIDDDQTAYLIYTSIANRHGISIEKLTEDYLGSTQENSGFLAHGVEACSLFKRNGIYYALFDSTCCFCPQGSGAGVYTASSPLGPYNYQNNINRQNGRIIIPAQQTHVAVIPSPKGFQYVWMGDLWGSTRDGIKGHDLQYWSSPLQFEADGKIKPLVWEDTVVIRLP